MAKFRKKPVVIEAVQFNGNNLDELIDFSDGLIKSQITERRINGENYVIILTLEGEMKANEKDFIIKGVNGEFYPCKPDIFEKTYELVEDNYSIENKDLSFDKAIEAAKAGKKIARSEWNKSGMFAYFVPADEYPEMNGVAMQFFDKGNKALYRFYWVLKTNEGNIFMWTPLLNDSLANDWMIVE